MDLYVVLWHVRTSSINDKAPSPMAIEVLQ
jgi:hypothetical protein